MTIRTVRLAIAVTAGLGGGLLASPTLAAASPWWEPAGLAGKAVTRVVAGGGRLTAVAAGQVVVSPDGRSFVPGPAGSVPVAPSSVTAGKDVWWLSRGRVYHAHGGGTPVVDAGSPDLGAGAHIVAAPLETPGVVVAVGSDSVVWRRAADGTWRHSLLLLPRTLVTGTPEVTAAVAFSDRPVSGVIYIGTSGFGTLLSTDGGDDWTRADPGLPGDVLSLATDSSTQPPVVWAGTSDGLFVHRVQAQPTIPVYAGGDLTLKALLTLVVCLLVTAAASVALVRLLSPERNPPAVGPG